ncbi:MAG TPA: efflux RND transporter permease subunit [Candidatus Krumholzibacteria bacterium]|nr:efflux RND transporter permease subunit [Candidatus Krumholzibacteria bacterium]HPD72612.1 efflux RND transporter permease subunit [Candidatus Krumholzibacteria bacterium]HRY40456.1 efflux RND transporter permease subunit [Candidatus Krumholzibacteria bacterium]
MKLSELSIRRPVFSTVMSLAVILLGVISFTRLPVREYPDVEPPIVSVSTLYRGASPSVVETEITDVLEEQFSTIEGVKSISSSSQEQGSVITIEFELARDVDVAANDVRDRVARVRGELPREADDPIIAKVDVNAQPIIWIAFSSDRYTTLELSDVADRILKEHLQRLEGVGSVFIGGERRYSMRVWLDPQRLAGRGLTTQDVEQAIRAENAEIPGGRVEGAEREFAVRTRGELQTADEFAAIVVAQRGNDVVRLGDVATVEVGPEDERTVTRYNGRPAIGLGIVKQKQASTVDVAEAVREALPQLQASVPAGMILDTAYDSATFIEESLDEVASTLLLATGLVVLVVLLFLKSFRATVIPIVAIPIAIIGAFTVAFALGFTVNIITLLALVLAIGLVVDDAIVVLENCFRHLEMGKHRLLAARDGVNEIAFAVIATTVALVAVFVPVAFLTGSVGRLFREFGITLAVAVLISAFVALTLTPALCSLMLRRAAGHSRSLADRSFAAFFTGLDRAYCATLDFVLRRRLFVLAVTAALLVASGWFYTRLPRELVPTEDRGIGFGIVIAPEGATLEYTDRYQRQIEEILLNLPERRGLFSAIGLGFGGPGRVTNGFMFLNLKPREERERTQQEIVDSLFPQLFAIPGVLAFVVNPPSLGGRFSSTPIEYVLQGENYDSLNEAVQIFLNKAGALGYLVNLDSDLKLNKPQLDVAIDRDRASALGVSVTDIGTTLETFLGGRVVGEFKRGSKKYDIIAQLRPANRATPDVIREIYLRSGGGELVQLANLVNVRESVAPKELNHYNRVRSATISANLAPGVDLGRALDALDRIVRDDLPAGIHRELAGQSREYRETSGTLTFMFLLAVAFIYLVLAAQFESFVHPFVILLSVPLAVVGALASLFLLKQSMNIYSQIGLVMLIGLVTKNAILIVEFSNQLRARGHSIREAVREASRIRLRPILMTSLSTVFGILPIAIGVGAGAESRQPLGVAIVGGVLFSTFLTLLLVPVVYSLLARFTAVELGRDFAAAAGETTGAEAPPPAAAMPGTATSPLAAPRVLGE